MHHSVILPYPSLAHSAAVLDRVVMGTQRGFCYSAIGTLKLEAVGARGAWSRLPGVRMWEGCTSALAVYLTFLCREWAERGYPNAWGPPYGEDWQLTPGWRSTARRVLAEDARTATVPDWLGGGIHSLHRSVLLAHSSEHYGGLGWTEAPATRTEDLALLDGGAEPAALRTTPWPRGDGQFEMPL